MEYTVTIDELKTIRVELSPDETKFSQRVKVSVRFIKLIRSGQFLSKIRSEIILDGALIAV